MYGCSNIVIFDLRPGPKILFQGDAPEGSDTFQWPVIERDRVGGLRLIIWDKVKVPLCHHREMHWKRVTSELHDSYFRLMTIKHAISKIEWALNYYIAQSRQKSSQWSPSSSRAGGGEGRGVVGKATSGRRGFLAQMSWGPEKMLIRCCKESQHPAEWTPGVRLSIKRTRKTQRDGHNSGGQNIAVYVRSPAPSHTQNLNNLFEPLQIK